MKRITKQKKAKELVQLRMPKPIEEQIGKIMKEPSQLKHITDDYYRRSALCKLFREQGKDFVPLLWVALRTSKHPLVRSSARRALSEIREEQGKLEDEANCQVLLETIFGKRVPAKAPLKELTQELLNRATRIYCYHAWGRAPTDSELYDLRLPAVLQQIEEGGEFECRLGCQDIGAGNMKLFITKRNSGFEFWVYENDYGCPDEFKEKNQETVRKIEDEWKRNGIPVLQRTDSGKS